MSNIIPIKVGLSKSKIIGNLRPEILQALRDQVSFRVQGYFFAPEYKRGVWDGRKHLITEKGQVFATGLLGRVVTVLNTLGIETQVVDDRKMPPASQFMPIRIEEQLYPYQKRAVDAVIEARRCTMRVATGGGKTRMGAAVIAELERPAIFLVHRLDLMHQVLDVLRGYTDDDGVYHEGLMLYPEIVGQVGGGIYEPNIITVATVQTLCAALDVKYEKGDDDDDAKETGAAAARPAIEKMLEECQVIIGDECHHAPADTIYKILEKIPNAVYRIGLSATDWRDDGADLMIEAAYGPRVVDITASDLIEWKYLVPPFITMYPMAQPPEKISARKASNWNAVYSHFYSNNEHFHHQVLEIARSWYWEGRTTLILVERVAHGRILEEMLNERGIEAVFASGKDKADVRKTVFNRVRRKDLRVLIGTSIADEGLDIRTLDALILAGGGKASTRAYQRIGRVIRTWHDKTNALVADFRCRDSEWLDEHARTRLRIYKREKRFVVKEIKT